MAKHTVGLFGTYWIANYGDDLMALLFAKHLREAGHDVLVYGLNGYEGQFGISVTNDAKALVEQSDVLVLGGGGYLVPRAVKFTSSFHCRMEEACHTIASRVRQQAKPLFAVSIGGAGEGTQPEQLPPGWRALLKEMRGITVRNAGDVTLAKQFCDDVEHHADVVWLAPELARPEPTTPLPDNTILMNYPVIRDDPSPRAWARWARRELPWILRRKALERRMPGHQVQPMPAHVTAHGQATMMDNMLLILDKLRQCPVVVSNALHVGMTSLAAGNGFVSFHGPAKTRVFMEEVGIDGFCGDSLPCVAQRLSDWNEVRQRCGIDGVKREHLQSNARNHIVRLLEWVTT